MPSLPPYIPAKEADFTNFLSQFSSLITAGPAAYGLLPSDADTISALNSQWVSNYTPVTSKSSNTALAVQNKNAAKVNVTAQIRTYAQNIANNPGVSTGNKVALGLNPKTSTPQPVTAPSTSPVLNMQSLSALSGIFRYRDSAASVSVKSKPYGVASCQVFGMTSDTPVTDPTTLLLVALPTKSPFILNFTAGQADQKMYLAARWITRTGLFGPWSPIINFTVVGAG